ncbi:T9SS type A sorting domain-containing protein [Mariniflexile soesokkakense]|uniref:T9SS type A sorting domain-containing protein n=1 Tax=Mariniflexile soesokkakense TaxID=1343160 RepID=A0ABV0ADD3_9FLAO
MKLKITFLFIGLLPFIGFSQIAGPPAPCGYFVEYACDDNEDGFAQFNLVELFPFSTFCREDKGNPEDYYPIVYYETSEDMYNETNPIINPETYTNTSSSQIIYYRANKISPDNIEYLIAENYIEVKRLAYSIPDYELYGTTQGESVEFDLTSVNLLCMGNSNANYTITYHLSQTDASSGINSIATPSSYSINNSQDIYVRGEHNSTDYVEMTSFVIRVLFAVAHDPVVPSIYKCDFDEDRQDGIYVIDLTEYNSVILGNQDPENFTVSYYASLFDADSKVNILPSIYAVSDQQTIYARVDENTMGSYAITSFVISIFTPPIVSSLDPYEVCDDDGDGKAVFDLSIIWDIINSGGITYDMPMFENYEDALNGDGNSHLGFANDYYNYTNVTNPQTIYVKVEDMDGFGCYTILPLELVVKDCSQAGVIEVNAFHDANTNTTFDTNEIKFLSGTLTYEKNNDGIQHVLYTSTGIFNIISDVETDTYDIGYSIYDEFQDCYSLTTYLYENVSVTNGSRVNYNFPVTKIKECSDVAVYLTPVNPPRPGFDYSTNLIIRNLGIETISSGSVEFIKDDLVTFKSVSFVDSGNSITNTSTGFILNFNNLQPNSAEHVVVNMNVPVSVNLGDLLTSTATYSVDDLDVSNNISILTETVIGSYDPNDIAESHGPEILYDNFTTNDYLYYTVRFQNVGTADAISVSIDNTLDSKLDKSTIQMLNASHDYVFTRTDNQLNWKFDNIQLPSESMDEPNSHGYVYYKIKPTAGYKVSDIIPNTAEIYFDFNPAVVTNTFETEFITTLASKQFNVVDFSIFPNPTKGLVELIFNNKTNSKIQVDVYNIQGKLILNSEHELKNKAVQINVSNLKSGLYFLKASDGLNNVTRKLIVD